MSLVNIYGLKASKAMTMSLCQYKFAFSPTSDCCAVTSSFLSVIHKTATKVLESFLLILHVCVYVSLQVEVRRQGARGLETDLQVLQCKGTRYTGKPLGSCRSWIGHCFPFVCLGSLPLLSKDFVFLWMSSSHFL